MHPVVTASHHIDAKRRCVGNLGWAIDSALGYYGIRVYIRMIAVFEFDSVRRQRCKLAIRWFVNHINIVVVYPGAVAKLNVDSATIGCTDHVVIDFQIVSMHTDSIPIGNNDIGVDVVVKDVPPHCAWG